MNLVNCPACKSSKIWKDGLRQTAHGNIQRFVCRVCGFRFSEKTLNSAFEHRFQRQICVSAQRRAKNLAEVEPLREGPLREATYNIKGKLIEFSWWLKKEGYKLPTIKGKTASLRRLRDLGADLWKPESVKDVIAQQDTWCTGTKANVVNAYSSFLHMIGLAWKPPRYKITTKLPFIPMESELEALISACGKVIGTFLQGLKDSAADPGELARIEWIDINTEAKTLSLKEPVKGHNPRMVPVSEDFLRRLQALPQGEEHVFRGLMGLSANFYRQRKRLAVKLNNPRLAKIKFTTFRHWKATMEYHKTKDVIHVQQLLGHKNIQNTMIYINLEQALFRRENDEFHVKVAHNTDEACKLVEVGFEYVTGDYADGKIFRKRK